MAYLYSFIRKMYATKEEEYNALPTNEFEMSLGNKYANSTNSINAHNDLELLNEDNNLLDCEIKQEKKGKNKRNNEL